MLLYQKTLNQVGIFMLPMINSRTDGQALDKNTWIGLILSIFTANTWVLPYENFGPNGLSWTICTLFFWYWMYPFILPRFQRLTDKQIASGIVRNHWLQIFLAYLVITGFGRFSGSDVSNIGNSGL